MSSGFDLPEGTHTVILGVGDLNGIMRGKRIPASHWDHVCKSGNALSIALLAIDMTCDVWDTPYVNFDNGYPDMHVFPMTKPVAVPWEPGVAVCFGRAEGMDHKPVPIDPRQALVRQVDRARDMGFEVNVGTELEFYLLDPETGQPRDTGIQVYGLGRAARMEHIVGPIRQQINECGIPIEQSNPEYAAGQIEVNIRYGEALAAADRVVLFKSLIRQLGIAHDYLATFMPKPFFDQSGNGFHTHYSLWKDGKNAFADNGKINDTGKSFIAGLQKRMCETAICGSGTVNGYRRRQPYTFCPINASWGYDNRTVGIRVIEGSDSAVRVEKRDAGADANPYLLLAAEIAAGLDGIEQGLSPSEPTTGNGYEEGIGDPIPTDLPTAIDLARGSEWLRDVMGEMQWELVLQQAERELEFFNQQVTQVELDRYLRAF
ncbi:glutamine synthetase [Ruegeria sp. HKCCD6228]|uniref:Glutamine synthetase n=1 Tax=Ruegeria atlantica TaxID=81569 RepID=A0AA91BZG7_9RHOB|nr:MULTISPECIES: glutamine synthetase family protein [Ruegeria]NOC81885.1 glutamine synthetase [Ruegeria sp. HKCCD6428]NOC92938.1 glutamine synthetase [Ruegeria sp. HKCCD6604]NOD29984.1 glutamine synthetase [Ruegeria atlantica]NOD98896.1 glutamine synthetase [Ruegeria sp. HKCCD6228]NOE17636.1 glutamine synthetase [Ruegeria atlantica]